MSGLVRLYVGDAIRILGIAAAYLVVLLLLAGCSIDHIPNSIGYETYTGTLQNVDGTEFQPPQTWKGDR